MIEEPKTELIERINKIPFGATITTMMIIMLKT